MVVEPAAHLQHRRALPLGTCWRRRYPPYPQKQTSQKRESMSASLIGRFGSSAFKLSTTSVVGVAHGLALLFGIGTEALPLWDPRMRRTNLRGGLTEAEPSGPKISPHPSSREGHHPTMWWSLGSFLSRLVAYYHAATASCRIQQNSVPSIQMRCMITANRRASATIAFFTPRRLAICIAQLFSQDHFVARISSIWAAS